MRYAEVSVNSPIAQRRTFSYSLPSGLNIELGQAVWVPFGEKTLQGIVLDITPYPAVAETREIIGIIESLPLLSSFQISLAKWLSQYYLAALFESVALMLPPGFERRVITMIKKSGDHPDISSLIDQDSKEVLDFIWQSGSVDLKDLEKSFGQKRIKKVLNNLINQHYVLKEYILEKPRIKPKIVSFVSLKIDLESARKALACQEKKPSRQVNLLQYLIDNPYPHPLPVLKQKVNFSPVIIKTLVEKGLLEIKNQQVDRDPLANRNFNLSFPLTLTQDQERVLKSIHSALLKKRSLPSPPDVFLLRGVTGSGKTEIYIQAVEETVKLGKRSIVLVPEISLTPQMIERFVSRLPGKVAVLHSELTPGERFDEWWRIKNGEFSVVIGSRSAIFAPQPDLGLIVIDEEHEWTYKQQENGPRYHAREVALKLAGLTGAVVVLGSATPDVVSYYKAKNDEYHLLELSERVTPQEGSPLPLVEVVDLRKELKSGNLSLFSNSLSAAINTALKNREQVLLFLNRRGTASFVECRDCGWVIRCRRCDVPLSYHFAEDILVCHQCNYHMKTPEVCPHCGSRRIKYLGVGTEKLEQETGQFFPQARLLRWDSDVIRGHQQSHDQIFSRFKAGKADILIGTQMVAKGLDLPGLTLVGVVSADTALNLPDFRAGERTFQLLSQVAGRAGRGIAGGRVIIQTYFPEHYAVQAAARHDYLEFLIKEIAYRREFNNPPFSRLAKLMYSHNNDSCCQQEAERMKNWLVQERDAKGLAGINLIGPAPAFIHRIRGRFRWQIILRSSDPGELLSEIPFPKGWTIDIDPVGL